MKRLLLLFIMFLMTLGSVLAQTEARIFPSEIGQVQHIEYADDSAQEYTQTKQIAEIKIVKGIHKGSLISVENILTGNPYYDINLKNGKRVILHVEEENGEPFFSIEGIERSGILIWLSLLFCAMLVYVGKKKGLLSLISIVITCFLIFNLLSPMILAGLKPVLGTIIICLLSTAITMYLVGGFNKKSTAATLGCCLSLAAAGILSFITVKTASLTGFSNEHTMFLYSAHPELDFVSIIISTMMLATLGAVMDVGMSIASTINEISEVDSTKTVKELFTCGMNVGRDIIGTMANTLILVYLGGALPLIMLASNIDLQKFINLNQVVTEISSALIGSIAIVICVPITAIVASELVKRPKLDS